MPRRRLRLHYRIVIPFVLIAIVIPAAGALIALSLITGSLESRVTAQARETVALVSRSDYAINASIVASVRQIANADVVTFTAGGAIIATTLDPTRQAGLAQAVMAADATREVMAAAGGTTVVRISTCAGEPCVVAYRRVAARPDAIVALIINTSELDAVMGTITRTILLSAVLSVLVMAFVSQIVTRRVTGPLERLVEFTRGASPGLTQQRAAAGDDEVGRLATAFNDMLDRLDRTQGALVRSEKLALTGLLAARVAHDIRNPLSSIKMQTQLLAQSKMDGERASPLLQAMLRDIAQVESVVRDLLELARPGELTRTRSSLNDVIAEVLEQLAPQLAHRKIAVMTDCTPSLPAVDLDVERFKQAVLNVMVNATDAMSSGGTLQVATRSGDASGTLILEICDDGVGVAPDMVDRVFDPFVSTKREGVGLGLVNAKAVVGSHGGRIELAARQPKGTCVTIWLPVGTTGPVAEPGDSGG